MTEFKTFIFNANNDVTENMYVSLGDVYEHYLEEKEDKKTKNIILRAVVKEVGGITYYSNTDPEIVRELYAKFEKALSDYKGYLKN